MSISTADGPPPTEYDLGCFWHGAEPIPEGAYRVCGECGHVWATADDLVLDVAKMCIEIGLNVPMNPDPESVYYCPLCAHDF